MALRRVVFLSLWAAVGALLSPGLALSGIGPVQVERAAAAPAAIPPPPARRVVVFKNGVGFFTREGEVTFQNGEAVFDTAPTCSLGGYWAEALEPDLRVEELTAFREIEKQSREATNLTEALLANRDQAVILRTAGGETLEGILRVYEAEPETGTPPGAPAIPPYLSARSNYPGMIPPPAEKLYAMETLRGVILLERGQISGLQFPEEARTRFESSAPGERLRLRVAPPREKAAMRISYLRKDIGWTPAYRIDITDKETAKMELRATLINDAEDFAGAEVAFTVGYPNFMFADTLSPLGLDQTLGDFLRALETSGSPVRESPYANVMRQSASPYGMEAPAYGDYTARASQAPPSAEGDLYFYARPGVTLRRGERGDYELFRAGAKYHHLYEWNLGDTTGINPQGYQSDRGDSGATPPRVWHSIKLENQSGLAWTTAPALVIAGGAPLAQGTLDYTPAAATTNLKLTVASDVQADANEVEIARERQVQLQRRNFDKVTIQGTLKIKNYKAEPIQMEIVKTLTGEVIEAGREGRPEKRAEGVIGVNPVSRVTWNIPLAAGEAVEIPYQYFVFVAN